ncbi:hypothetical protein JXL21_06470 [Candidatus Bathyarchaeota archaeon]|nr:hypothetical protein [Candidatus Bathyarchaeota archaeon]
MVQKPYDIGTIDDAIKEIEDKIKTSAEPYYIELLDRLKNIQREQNKKHIKGGFKGFGIS